MELPAGIVPSVIKLSKEAALDLLQRARLVGYVLKGFSASTVESSSCLHLI